MRRPNHHRRRRLYGFGTMESAGGRLADQLPYVHASLQEKAVELIEKRELRGARGATCGECSIYRIHVHITN
jgi:hypothetical protein